MGVELGSELSETECTMRRFLQSMAGSFFGKILAGLTIAICVALGFGPAQWANALIGNVPILISIARLGFLLLALLSLALLVISIRASRLATVAVDARSAMRRHRRRARIFVRIKIQYHFFKKGLRDWWRLVGPNNYEVPLEVCATSYQHYRDLAHDRIAFSQRFADAFPGCRHLFVEKDTRAIIRRLNVFLRWPLTVVAVDRMSGRTRYATPFYWNSGTGNMHLTRYHQYKTDMVLLNEIEIRPSYLAAIGGDVYWLTFVYLELAPLPPIVIRGEEGFTPHNYQEFAIYEGKVFNRQEYDDGAYIDKGRPIRFKTSPDLRSRDLRPRGMLIIPNSSPANSPERDRTIATYIDRIIVDKAVIDEFATYLLALPKEEHRALHANSL